MSAIDVPEVKKKKPCTEVKNKMVDEITLKEYFEKIIEERDKAVISALAAERVAASDRSVSAEKAVVAALASAEKAVSVSEKNAEQWRAGANEWRGAMTDREVRFMTVDDRSSILKELKEVRDFMTAHNGTVTQIAAIETNIKDLNTFKDNMNGKADQSTVTVSMIFSSIAAIAAVIALILNLVNTLAK